MKIILNNKKNIESILNTRIIPDGTSVRSVIGMMAKLFHERYLNTKDKDYLGLYYEVVKNNKEIRNKRKKDKKQYSPKIIDLYKDEYDELVKKIKEEMIQFKLPVNEYEEYKFSNYIRQQVKLTIGFNRVLRSIDNIKISKAESEYINVVSQNDNEKKILFTLFCLCKTQADNGFVNLEFISDTELFKMANVSGTKDKKMYILYELSNREIINMSMKRCFITEYNDIEKDEEVDFVISDFEMLGNTFLNKYKDGYKMCEGMKEDKDGNLIPCGKLIKIKKNTNDYSTKYCEKCKKTEKLRKQREWYERQKEASNE